MPIAGGPINDYVMMLGTTVAGWVAKTSRGGIVESEKQKFIDNYGIDPDKTDNANLKKAFSEQLNYTIRHSLPMEILTGTKNTDRGML